MRVVISQFEGIDVTPALPLAAGCLVAVARADPQLAGCSYAIEVERRPLEQAVAALGEPSVLGLSLYPWNSGYSLAVGERARAAFPEALLVAGGPSVPRRPDGVRRFLADHPWLDVLVFAEGEHAFRELLRARRAGGSREALEAIGGIALRGPAGEVALSAPPGRVMAFGEASPFLDGTFDELLARHPGRFTMALAETNRGCPFSCTFCDWSLTKHVVELPLERVRAELTWIVERGFQHMMLADANFGIRPRDLEIARFVAELRRERGAPQTFYWYLTKNDHARNLETIEILQAAEIGTWVGLAVQDFDDEVLAAVQRSNIQTREAMTLREICGERGIPSFNELILGLPGQTYASFTATMVAAMPPLPRHDFVLFLCRMIDNTELGDPASRERHGIVTRRCEWKTISPGWDPIVDEVQEVVVGTRDLPPSEWERCFCFGFFCAALYNLRLLRVVLAYLGGEALDVRACLAHLVEGPAPAGSVYAQLQAVLGRYASSILASGPIRLPEEGGDEATRFTVEDALTRAALARYDEFLSETEGRLRAHLGQQAPPALGEAFAYQGLITPRWGAARARALELSHDWPAYLASQAQGALVARRARVRFTPPPYASLPTFAAFATTHVSCVRARLEIGALDAASAPRSLAVLPRSD